LHEQFLAVFRNHSRQFQPAHLLYWS